MLTSLELFGFKSFADRTLFEFSPGITCVVGPNGSGKSNVVDSIKWLLGDQSPKSLRGKEMSDVIFNGSSGRKASGFAEATLTFDNRNGLLALDAPEVRVGRRLYTSGDSEYLLNGAVVRLKDIRDLFMGTGAGTAAYSIIEQGRVDQILQGNSTTRRVVFEEAAGISRYKSRKVDAERKLEKVAQNLLRLTDIVDEVEVQLGATRSQASKAAKYRELSSELKTLWTGLAADDARHLNAELEKLSQQESEVAAELEQVTSSLTELQAEKSELEARLGGVDDELSREEKRLALEREQIAAHESTIRHQSSRSAEFDVEIARLRQDRIVSQAQAVAVREDLWKTEEQLQQFSDRLELRRREIEERQEHASRLQEELDRIAEGTGALQQSLGERRQEQADAERQLARLQSQLEAANAAAESIEAKQSACLADEARAVAERDRREEALLACEAAHADQLQGLAEAQERTSAIAREQSELEQTLSALRERRSAAVARIHVLEDLERRQEGISVGVREILRRAHDTPHPPWNEVLGAVGDLLQVSLDNAPLLEVALGARSQLVVVRRLEPMLEWVNSQTTPLNGRVGFVPLNDSLRACGELDLHGRSGVVGRADELAEEIPEAAGLAAQLLSDTWIVDTLDTATALWREVPTGRFVTLQGELIERDGTLYAGTIPNTTALVSRRSELRNLRREVLRIDRDQETAAERLAELETAAVEAARELEERECAGREAMQELAAARGRLSEQQREVDRVGQHLAELEAQLDRAREDRLQLESTIAQVRTAIAERDEAMRMLLQEIDEASHQDRELRDRLRRLHDELNGFQLELATHEERLAGLRRNLERLQADQAHRDRQSQQAERRLADALSARRQTRLAILRTRAAMDETFLSVESLTSTVRGLARHRGEVKRRWTELNRTEEDLHKRRRRLLDVRHDVELRVREAQRELDQLGQRIDEEYQLRLGDLVASGVSAFRMLIAERYPEETGESGGDDSREIVPIASLYETAAVRFVDVRDELEGRVERLRRKLKMMGGVNTEALEKLEDLESRYEHLSQQLQDLQEAKTTLEEIIRRVNKESRRIFLETFETIRTNFQELYRKLFGGGEGDIVLEDPEDVLECGIDIVARPPGKELRSISLLSGGEKTMTAVALLFAMFKAKPSPYCILDEVDAALDEANVDRYVSVVKEFAERTQFVIITHRKRTMTAADVLYGVTMEQAGVSKRMVVRFEDVSEDGQISSSAEAA